MSLRSRDLCPSNAEPTELDVNVLDQITVADLSDQEALDDFLNSTSDTTTESSLHSGSPTVIISRIQLIFCSVEIFIERYAVSEQETKVRQNSLFTEKMWDKFNPPVKNHCCYMAKMLKSDTYFFKNSSRSPTKTKVRLSTRRCWSEDASVLFMSSSSLVTHKLRNTDLHCWKNSSI